MGISFKIDREYRETPYSIEADLESLKNSDIGKIFDEMERFIDGILSAKVETGELDEIAVHELDCGQHGSFLEHFLMAWQYADPSNKRALKPVFEQLVKKYKLRGVK